MMYGYFLFRRIGHQLMVPNPAPKQYWKNDMENNFAVLLSSLCAVPRPQSPTPFDVASALFSNTE